MGYDYSILFENEQSKIGINKFSTSGSGKAEAFIRAKDEFDGTQIETSMNEDELKYLYICLKDCFEDRTKPPTYVI